MTKHQTTTPRFSDNQTLNESANSTKKVCNLLIKKTKNIRI